MGSVAMSQQTNNGLYDPRVSTPTISSSYWRLKGQGGMNYEMRQAPIKPKNADILTNAYNRDFQRKQDSLNYYQDLRDQYLRDRRSKEEKQKVKSDMDHQFIQKEVNRKITI